MTELFILLVLFQIKHFVCDYPLQTPYMLGKMNRTGWVKPLAAHAYIHSAGTWFIAYWFLFTTDKTESIFLLSCGLALTDFVIHFIVDRIKASPDLGGRFKPDQPYFWWALGADQMAHHLTHYVFIYLIITI